MLLFLTLSFPLTAFCTMVPGIMNTESPPGKFLDMEVFYSKIPCENFSWQLRRGQHAGYHSRC